MESDETRSAQGALRLAAARAVAGHVVPDDVLERVGKRLAALPAAELVRGLDICTHGICLDYFVDPGDWRKVLDLIQESPVRIRHIDWFPWGIIRDDLIQLRVEYQFDELAQVALPSDPVPWQVGRHGLAPH